MNWTEQIDGYCERVDFTYWAEPVNAVTNAAFLIAALWMAWRLRGSGLPLGWAMVVVLAVIGVGSYLFHTHATVWAVTADVVPIVIFVLLYVFAANLHFWRWPLWLSLLGTAAFIPYAAATIPVFDALGFLGSSASYGPVPLLIAIYAFALRNRHPETARGLAIGVAILCLSLTFRTIDEPLCPSFPMGTHFLWHCLNGLMLGWMIEVYRRHMVAEHAAQG